MVEAPNNLEYVDCPICGQSPTTVWMDDGKPTRYIRCVGCGTVFASPRISRAARMAWLDANFCIGENALALETARRPALRREAQIIQAFKDGGRLLDVGCSTGALFEFFDEAKWRRYGVEVSPSAAAYAAKMYRAQVHAGTLSSAGFPGAYFDVVTMIDMFYYQDDPRAELREALRVIRPGGVLCIEISGTSYTLLRNRGLLCWLLNGRWSRLRTDSSYLYWYTPQALDRLLWQTGFKSVQWEVIGSPAHSGPVRHLASVYAAIATKVTRLSRGLLTWAPKYICVSRPLKPEELDNE